MTNRPAARAHSSFRGTIGLARTEITPPVGIYARNWGAATHDVAESIHMPFTLSVLTLRSKSSGKPLVLIDADLGWWRPISFFHQFQQRLLEALSLSAEQMIFALSHTHASAPLMEPDPELAGGDLLGPWHESLFEKCVAAVREALASTFSGTLDWHSGTCHLAAIRDLPDPEGDRYLCGFNPDAEPDSTLVVGRVTDARGQLRAVIVNYACHPTTLAWENKSLSPDFPGAMRQTIEQNEKTLAFFLQGNSGDLAPRHQYVGETEVADRHGRQLAHAALATLNDMNPPGTELRFEGAIESGAPLALWRPAPRECSTELKGVNVELPLDLKDWPSADELEQQRLACTDHALKERLRRKRDIRRAIGDDKTFPLVISAWRIGDALLVGSCCEAYSCLQQELRGQFPDRTVISLNLINGAVGYLPPAGLYERDIYPVWQTPFARGSLEKMQQSMTEILQQLLAD